MQRGSSLTRHYRLYQKGEKTSSNPTAIIFAWSGGIKRRGQLDGTQDVVDFANAMEDATIKTIESGTVTGDLARLIHDTPTPPEDTYVDTEGFIKAIAGRLKDTMDAG